MKTDPNDLLLEDIENIDDSDHLKKKNDELYSDLLTEMRKLVEISLEIED